MPLCLLVFSPEAGGNINASNLIRSFGSARNESGIEHVRFHDLGHTIATRLVPRSADIYVVMEVLGHESIMMNMAYAHHCSESLRNEVDVLDAIRS